MSKVSPGEHPHADQPNFQIDDYLQMCRDGEAKFTVAEAARLLGWSRAQVYRSMIMASVSDEEFEEIMDTVGERNGMPSATGIVEEIRRRRGLAKDSIERCPHCGEPLRNRLR